MHGLPVRLFLRGRLLARKGDDLGELCAKSTQALYPVRCSLFHWVPVLTTCVLSSAAL